MERGDAWSCGRRLMTMRAELRIKANMLKMSEQKEGRALPTLLSHCPNPETSYLKYFVKSYLECSYVEATVSWVLWYPRLNIFHRISYYGNLY